MSWELHHRRRAAIAAVLAYAEKNPSVGPAFDYLPEVRDVFSSRRELVLALQHDWSQALWARIELLSLEPKGKHALVDARDLAARAWAECADSHPVLRRLLDACADEIGPSPEREQPLPVSGRLEHSSAEKVHRTPSVA